MPTSPSPAKPCVSRRLPQRPSMCNRPQTLPLDADTLRRQGDRFSAMNSDYATRLHSRKLKQLDDAQAQLAALVTQRDKLTSELSHRDSVIAEHEDTKRRLQADCDRLASQIEKSQESHEKLQETLQEKIETLTLTVNESLAISRTAQTDFSKEHSQTLHKGLNELKEALSRSEEASRASQLDSRHELHDELCEMKHAVSESLSASSSFCRLPQAKCCMKN